MNSKIVVLTGAIEQISENQSVSKYLVDFHSNHLQIVQISAKNLPHFNTDLFKDEKFPKEVEDIRKKAQQSEGIILICNQYFGMISAGLKNAYDWLSYSPNLSNQSPIKLKSACIIVLSKKQDKFIQVHQNFLQISKFCKLKVMEKPSINLVSNDSTIFDSQKALINEKIKKILQDYLESFYLFLEKNKK